jgi:hypothetical protein
VQKPKTLLGIRVLNQVGGWLRRLGFRSGELTEQTILNGAKRQTGLDDFGDSRFLPPFRALVQSYETDPGLTFLGRTIAQRTLRHLVANRMRIHHDLMRYPEILSGQIRRPLFVVGLPRTGTTLLQNLLSLDPVSRPLYFWESMSPSPPPDPRTRDHDPRIKAAERMVQGLYRAVPALPSIHAMHPNGPDECLGLLFNTLVTPFFRGKIGLYRDWLDRIDEAEHLAAYREYRQQLLMLQWRCPGDHWVLKCPSHLFGLSALLTVFPDACIVHTHRDLIEAIPSLCSMSAALDGLSYEEVDLEGVGQRTLRIVDQLLTGAFKARQTRAPGRFLDLPYTELIKDPIATVRRIYQHFNYEYNDTLEDKMMAYLAANPQHKLGAHQYSLEDFRLDPETIRVRYTEYYQRFEVGSEQADS